MDTNRPYIERVEGIRMDKHLSADRGRFVHLICLAGVVGGAATIFPPSASAQPLVTVSPPAPIRTDPGPVLWTDSDPQLLTNGTGTWLIFWFTSSDLGHKGSVFARSTDNGATWSEPLSLAETGESLRVVRGSSDTLIAAWTTTDDPDGALGDDSDLYFARSTDFGGTWSDPAPLNTNAGLDVADDLYAQIATDGKGLWLAIWATRDQVTGETQVNGHLTASSNDDGASWTAPIPLELDLTDPGISAVVANVDGSWLSVWAAKVEPSVPDLFVALSTDTGATWTDPTPLRNDALPIGPGWPKNHRVRIRQDQSGNLVAVWNHWRQFGHQRYGDFYVRVARSTDGGRTWTDPVSIGARTSFMEVTPPVFETDQNDRWVLAWRSDDRYQDEGWISHTEIATSYSSDGAVEWSEPMLVHQSWTEEPAVFPACRNIAKQLVYDQRGNWLLLW